MSEGRIAWHPAFFEAIQAELVDYRDILAFEAEHTLNAEPLKIDVLIIKKLKDAVIHKNIGAIFRAVNILEFKSRKKSISFVDFHKACAYVNLYQSLNNIPVTDVTMSIIVASYPRNLIKYLRELCGFSITKISAGIYNVVGNMFPIQILVLNKLSEVDNQWLMGLAKKVDPVKMVKIFRDRDKLKGILNLEAYFNAIITANQDSLKEVNKRMNARLRQTLIDIGIADELNAALRDETLYMVAELMLIDGDSIEKISRITNIPVDKLNEHFKQDV